MLSFARLKFSQQKQSWWNLSIIGLYIILLYMPGVTRYKNAIMVLIALTTLYYLIRDFKKILATLQQNLVYALLLFVLAMIYAVIISSDPALSLKEMNKPIINSLLLLSLTIPIILYKEQPRNIAIMVFVSFTTAFVILAGLDIIRYFIDLKQGIKPFTTYNHREFSYALLFFFPVILCLWALRKIPAKYSWLLLLAAGSLALILMLGTLARGAWISALIVAALILLVNRDWKLVALGELLIIVMMAIVFVVPIESKDLQKLKFKLQQTDSSYRYTNGTQGSAYELIKENPIIGYGYGGKAYNRVYNERVKDYPGWTFRTSIGPHNAFLSAWFAGGILGLFSIVIMSFTAIFAAVRLYCKNKDPIIKQAALLLMASFLGVFVIRGLFENAYINEIGIIFGLLLALASKRDNQNSKNMNSEVKTPESKQQDEPLNE